MNKERRKELAKIIKKLENLQSDIDSISTELAVIKDGEDEYRDNIPENLQSSERYEKAEAACDSLESALDALQDLDIEAIMEYINDAIEA